MSHFILFHHEFFSQTLPLIFFFLKALSFFLCRTLLHGFACLAFCQIFCENDSMSRWTENIPLCPTSFSTPPSPLSLHMCPSHVFFPEPPTFYFKVFLCCLLIQRNPLYSSVVCTADLFYAFRLYLWHCVPTLPCSEAILFSCWTDTPVTFVTHIWKASKCQISSVSNIKNIKRNFSEIRQDCFVSLVKQSWILFWVFLSEFVIFNDELNILLGWTEIPKEFFFLFLESWILSNLCTVQILPRTVERKFLAYFL